MTFIRIQHDIPSLVRETAEDGQRWYITPNGMKYPSVTTVIADHNKEAIDKWKARVGLSAANKISKNASDRGDIVHETIEALLSNYSTAEYTSRMLPHAKAVYLTMREKLVKHVTEVHGIEQVLYSDKLRLGGTTDCVGLWDNLLSIIDFKTALRLKKMEYVQGYLMQLTAYAFMFQELTGLEIKQGVILIGVDKEAQAQVIKLPRTEFDPHFKRLISFRDKYEGREAA